MKLEQKKGFLLRDFVIVGIVFGMIIAFFITMTASVANNYSNSDMISPTFASHYSKLSENLAKLDSANRAVQGSGGLNIIGAFNIAFNSVFTMATMVWDTVMIYTGMARNVPGDFSFLDYSTIMTFLLGLIAIIVTSLVFVWLSSVMRGKI